MAELLPELDALIEMQARLQFAKDNYNEADATAYGLRLLDFIRIHGVELRAALASPAPVLEAELATAKRELIATNASWENAESRLQLAEQGLADRTREVTAATMSWENAERRLAECVRDAERFQWLCKYPHIYACSDLLKKDQYVTLTRCVDALMECDKDRAALSASAGEGFNPLAHEQTR